MSILNDVSPVEQQQDMAKLLGNLTNWRPLGRAYDDKFYTVLNGYYKINLLINRMLIRNKAK